MNKALLESPQSRPDIFVSYTHGTESDNAWVAELVGLLRSYGFTVVFDQDGFVESDTAIAFMECGFSALELSF